LFDGFVVLLDIVIEHLDLVANIVILELILIDVHHQLFPSILKFLDTHIEVR